MIRFYSTYTYNIYDSEKNEWIEKKLTNVIRADALGLAKGTYTISISADNTTAISSATVNVINHDRSGFAFAPTAKTTSGAYNADGTLKDGAIVLYVTGDTAKNISYTQVKGQNASTNATYTGLQAILSESSLKKLTVPLDIRIIGEITKEQMDSLGSSSEGLQIKTTNEKGIMIEGIGHDATIYGFGFLIREAHYVELTNLGIYNFMDDGISIDTNNSYL